MSISGRILQFNIASSLSFHFRAGFASAYHSEPQAELQPKPRQKEDFVQLRENAIDADWHEQVPFYEVVGPYAPAATTALPERIGEKAALMPAKIPHNFTPNGKTGIAHSYNRKGQGLFAMMQASTIDLFI